MNYFLYKILYEAKLFPNWNFLLSFILFLGAFAPVIFYLPTNLDDIFSIFDCCWLMIVPIVNKKFATDFFFILNVLASTAEDFFSDNSVLGGVSFWVTRLQPTRRLFREPRISVEVLDFDFVNLRLGINKLNPPRLKYQSCETTLNFTEREKVKRK